MDYKVGSFVDSLPSYTEQQVAEHNKRRKRVWVTCRLGVYDVTDYIDQHPGGEDNIMLGAGTSIQPFWEEYPIHYGDETFATLESMRIGNLVTAPSAGEPAVPPTPSPDPFANDPKRNPRLKVVLETPFNAETPKDVIANSPLTPADLHYVQNHLPVPQIDISTYRLEIFDDVSGKKCFFTMADLTGGKFTIHTFPVTIQCGGNKRKFMADIAPVQGIMWDVSAIGTSEWTGVKLRDVLDSAKFDYLTNDNIKHIHFEGLDIDASGVSFSGSIPKEKLLKDSNDLLLAFKMNGAALLPDHGYPLRFIIPGCIGSRHIKWLDRIVLSSEECKSHWFKNDYRVLPPFVKSMKYVDISAYKPIYESPVQSGICQPVDGEKIDKANKVFTVKGFAFSGGGNSIEKVLVSMDGGDNWKLATLKPLQQAPRYKNCWTWTQWECDMAVPKDKPSAEIVCVATDSQQNSQPESMKAIWNAKGLVNNSWHKIKVDFK